MMREEDGRRREYFRRVDPLRVENTDDTELAYNLQNSTPNDPELLRRLLKHYAAEIYLWAYALLYFHNKNEPTHEDILAIVRQVFIQAISHPDKFHGQASISSWLFALCYQIIQRRPFRERIYQSVKPWLDKTVLTAPGSSSDWESLVK